MIEIKRVSKKGKKNESRKRKKARKQGRKKERKKEKERNLYTPELKVIDPLASLKTQEFLFFFSITL